MKLPYTSSRAWQALTAPLKFDRYVSPKTRNRFLAALVRTAILRDPEEAIRAWRDPKDDKFLELAVAGEARCLISGDADLLVLHPFGGIQILRPADFVVRMRERSE